MALHILCITEPWVWHTNQHKPLQERWLPTSEGDAQRWLLVSMRLSGEQEGQSSHGNTGEIFVLVMFSQLPNSHELETTLLASIRCPDLTVGITSLRQSNKTSLLSWANPHQLFTPWQKMLPPRRQLLPVLKTTLKPHAITLEKNERALLCKCYYCTIKLGTYTMKELSWGENTKYSG